MPPSRSSAFILATCLALVGGAAGAAYSTPNNPCSLLLQAQVSAALGVSVGAGKASGPKICRWAVPAGSPGGPALVLSMQDAKAFEYAKSPAKSATVVKTPAPGIGDDAVINTVGIVTATLTVKKGDVYFELHVYGFPVDQTKTMETTLAKEVIANLK